MRRISLLAFALSATLLGQKVETEGKAWLAANQDQAAVNVNGKWHAGEWGVVTLAQADGSRDVSGRVENRNILGVVSGKQVFLLLSEGAKVMYSVKMSPESPSVLSGNYADGLAWKSGARLMHMTRVDAPDHPGPDQAHVVVYRSSAYRGSLIKPSVYCDDQEAALIYKGSYFTVALSPGKHVLASSDQYTSFPIDAEAGATYYARVELSFSDPMRAQFKLVPVDKATAAKEMKKLKPEAAGHITRHDVVSPGLPAK